jgi:hypothetical protein
MVKAQLERSGNTAKFYLRTHFQTEHEISVEKNDDELFRLSGTAINEVTTYEGLILDIDKKFFRAFISTERTLEDSGILSPENWTDADRHCYITEFYPLDMEGQEHKWLISKHPIKDANHLFINIDILDGFHNVIRRCRVSPFTGAYKWLTL